MQYLAKVGPQEQASCRMLDPFADLDQVLQNVLGMSLLCPYETCSNCAQQIPASALINNVNPDRISEGNVVVCGHYTSNAVPQTVSLCNGPSKVCRMHLPYVLEALHLRDTLCPPRVASH